MTVTKKKARKTNKAYRPLPCRPDRVFALAANILAVYRRSTVADRADGMTWYRRARALVVETIDTDAATACGIAAAASVNRAWPRNVLDAAEWIRTGRRFHYKVQLNKCRRIRYGKAPLDVLRGQKERDFYKCLFDPADPHTVVIDGHAWSIAQGRRLATSKVRVPARGRSLEEVKEAYRVAAKELGILPNQLQAVTWVTWRRLHPLPGPHQLDKDGWK